MTEHLIEMLHGMSKEVVVVILAALPVSELRGAIPAAIAFGFEPLKAYGLSFFGNFLPVIPLLFLFRPISEWLRRFPFARRFFDWLFERTRKRAALVEKFEAIGLILFVAIPLPITGAWTGCVAATLFKVRFRYAFPAILCGIAIAGIIVMAITLAGEGIILIMRLKKGYVQYYTGDGKGKTTAALGLALRAAGAGLKVYIGQFAKQGGYSEISALKKLKKNISVEHFGRGCWIKRKRDKADVKSACHGLIKVNRIIESDRYDVVILDEIFIALYYELIQEDDVIQLIRNRRRDVELILTGRYASKRLMKYADLISVVVEKKHYYKCGVKARKGIEC